VFVFGGLTTLLMVPVVLRLLPESVDFLLAQQPQDALGKLNTLLRKMQRPVLQSLPARPVPVAGVAPVGGFKSLFSPAILRSTLLIWSAFFLLMFSFYFALSWTPKLLVAAGLSAQQGITGGVLLNLGGIVGGTLFGVLASRLDLGRLTAACLAITAVAMAVFGFVTGTLDLAFMAAFGIGMFIFGGMAGLYSFAPIIYPAAVRTTGMGWAIGIGRMGAILAPLTAGVLLDSGWAPPQLYYVFAIPLLLAVVAVLAIRAKAPAAGRASGTLAAAH
jgi:MFS family permease